MPFPPTKTSGNGAKFLAEPANFGAGVLPKIYSGDDAVFWGYEVALPGGESEVSALLVEFRLPRVRASAKDAMFQVEQLFDGWFGLVRDWVETITQQDLSVAEPRGRVSMQSSYVWSWHARRLWRNTTASKKMIQARMPNLSAALTSDQWNYAAQKANEGYHPPAPYLLLRDARARMNRDEFTYSVIFAGTAAELAIRDQIEEELLRRSIPIPLVDHLLEGTMGRLVEYCKDLGIGLPARIKEDLIAVRNKAVHAHSQISRDQARKAHDVAHQVVSSRIFL